MNKKQMIFGAVVLVAIVAVVGVVFATSSGKEENDPATSTQNNEGHQSSSVKEPEDGEESDSEAVQTNQVSISDFKYSPATITVKAGTKVTWTNNDTVQHDVAADKPSSDAPSSNLLGKGESFSFTFNKAGTYGYHCTPHPYMRGKVVVTD